MRRRGKGKRKIENIERERNRKGRKKGIQTKCGQTYFVEINGGLLEEDNFTSD